MINLDLYHDQQYEEHAGLDQDHDHDPFDAMMEKLAPFIKNKRAVQGIIIDFLIEIHDE